MKIGSGHIKLASFKINQELTLRVKAPMFLISRLPWIYNSQRLFEDFHIPNSLSHEQQATLIEMYQEAYRTYRDLVHQDVEPRTARQVLPMSVLQETEFQPTLQDLDDLEPDETDFVYDKYRHHFKKLLTFLKGDATIDLLNGDGRITLVGVDRPVLVLQVKAPLFVFKEFPEWDSILHRQVDSEKFYVPFAASEDSVKRLAEQYCKAYTLFRAMMDNEVPLAIARQVLPGSVFEEQLFRTTIPELIEWCDLPQQNECKQYAEGFRKILNFVT